MPVGSHTWSHTRELHMESHTGITHGITYMVLHTESHTWNYTRNHIQGITHGITFMESHTWMSAMQDLEMMKMTIKRLLAPVKRPASPSAPPPPAPAPPQRPPPPPPPGLPTAAALGSSVKMQQADAVSLFLCSSLHAACLLQCPCAQVCHQELDLLLCALPLTCLQLADCMLDLHT